MPTVATRSEWGIEAAEELKAALAPHLEAEAEVVVAVPEAVRVHTASLQVLLAFVRDRSRAGRPTRIDPCADALREAAALLGLDAALGLTSPPPQ
ncbi:MAG: STAS domain-containing protein [Xanthomonadaceae bacterium]|nr:STAS domain-containing protein [Xanthomonadaceae bacterium]